MALGFSAMEILPFPESTNSSVVIFPNTYVPLLGVPCSWTNALKSVEGLQEGDPGQL